MYIIEADDVYLKIHYSTMATFCVCLKTSTPNLAGIRLISVIKTEILT